MEVTLNQILGLIVFSGCCTEYLIKYQIYNIKKTA